jgi:hypothetical protein
MPVVMLIQRIRAATPNHISSLKTNQTHYNHERCEAIMTSKQVYRKGKDGSYHQRQRFRQTQRKQV